MSIAVEMLVDRIGTFSYPDLQSSPLVLSDDKMSITFQSGSVLAFNYPRETTVGRLHNFELRTVKILTARDLLRQPLTPLEFLRRPYVNRSRWLIKGIDLDKQLIRQMYLGSTIEHRAPCVLRLGLYYPNGTHPVEKLPRLFLPNRRDRRRLIKLVQYWDSLDTGEFVVRVFSDDLGNVG